MTNPRSKNELLSKTTISYLEEWMKIQIYAREKKITCKYFTKGIEMENYAISYAQMHIENNQVTPSFKNEKQFENDYMTGTPDVFFDDEVWDIKCSWDCFTFPLFEKKIPNKDYYYQLQGYMALTGLKKAKLVYVLADMPDDLIERELLYNENAKYEDYIYSNVDDKYRIKVFKIDRDEDVINAIKEKVIQCRNYLENLEK